jgi:hypothetical protein
MNFDWYQATIHEEPFQVLHMLGGLGDEVVSNDRVGKMYRYTQGFEIRKQGVPVAYCAMGGQEGETHAHAWATSDHAPAFADLVREEWPDRHLVTRLDACEDYIDSTAWKRLTRAARRVAKGHRVSFPSIRDALNPTAGRTQYMGSASSEYRARIYEKGWEVVGKAINSSKLRAILSAGDVTAVRVPGLDRECHPGEWVRAELQARPKGDDGRRAAAVASPSQVWTFTSWSHDFAKEALLMDIERFYHRARKHTTDERALRWMCHQYAGPLGRLRDDLGDWCCVGLQLGDMIEQIKREEEQAGV